MQQRHMPKPKQNQTQNQTILEQLQTTGLVPAATQLEADDIKKILKAYKCEILPIHADISTQAQEPESLIDASLKHVMEEALDELNSKNKVLFLIGHAGHWYLGEAFRGQNDNSIKFTLHDVRDEDQSNRNQQHVINTFRETARQLKTDKNLNIETTYQYKYPDDVQSNGYNCGDLVIPRGMLCMGFERNNDNNDSGMTPSQLRNGLLENGMTPDELRKQIIREAIWGSNIAEKNIEFNTLNGDIVALNKQHSNYVQNKQSLITQASSLRQQQTSLSSTYADLQRQLKLAPTGEIAQALGNDAKKLRAFVAANVAMNEILNNNILDKGDGQKTFESSFEGMSKSVEKGNEAEIEQQYSSLIVKPK